MPTVRHYDNLSKEVDDLARRLKALEARHEAPGEAEVETFPRGGADARLCEPLGGPISYAAHPLAEARSASGPDPWTAVREQAERLRDFARDDEFMATEIAGEIADRLDAAIRAARGEG